MRRHYAELKELGVDEVYCVSVNDAFSMFQWAKQLHVEHVKMLPDGNADFTPRDGHVGKEGKSGLRLSLLALFDAS